MKPYKNLDPEWLARELHHVDEFDEEWDSTGLVLDFGAAWAFVAFRFKEKGDKIEMDTVCHKGRENKVNSYSDIQAFCDDLDGLLYKDDDKVTEHILSDIRDALRRQGLGVGSKPAATAGMVATAILQQRHNKDTDRQEWALVSRKKDPKTGEHRVLYWFGARKPSDEAVKKQEQRIQYFKHKNG